MHIKNISISGFKSYDQQDFPEDFSPKHNVIVGKNGSGKSNFFFAIQFVLSDKYTNMRSDERREFLHEGAGRPVMTAYVEITFDNSDHRLMVDWGPPDEVKIRRTIGLKKDEFRVNGKTHTAQEVQSLLENAGFSSSNPYYIVQQGKIAQLTTMKEADRLNLLKEVAGTRVFEDRRTESNRLLEDSEQKIHKVDEAIQLLDDRLKDVEQDKEELTRYKDLERRRRTLEYAIYEKQRFAAEEALTKIGTDHMAGGLKMRELHEQFTACHNELKESERQRVKLDRDIEIQAKERSRVEGDRARLHRTRTTMNMNLQDIQSQVQRTETDKKEVQKQLKAVESDLKARSSELEALKMEGKTARYNENVLQSKAMQSDTRLNELRSRRGRASEFANQADRDAWLKKEISINENNKKNNQKQIDSLTKEINELSQRVDATSSDREGQKAKLNEAMKTIEKLDQRRAELVESRDSANSTRRRLFKESTDLNREIAQIQEDFDRASRRLDKTLSREIKQGLDAVRKVEEQFLIAGVYGPLIQLMTADAKFHTALEVTAGNALFNVVVKDDKVASEVLSRINQMKLEGRVTLMPLNRMEGKVVSFPKSPDVQPLLQCLTFQPEHQKAFQEIFGKTLLCATLDIANHHAKNNNVDTVTIEGDKVERKGALTGGFHDAKISRMAAFREHAGLKDKLDEKKEEHRRKQEEIADLDHKITNVLVELQKVSDESNLIKSRSESDRIALRQLTDADAGDHRAILEKQKSVELLKQSVAEIEAAIASLQDELKTEMRSRLTAAEEEELKKVSAENEKLTKDLAAARNKRMELEGKIEALSATVAGLDKKHAELTEQLYSFSATEASGAGQMTLEREASNIEHAIKELDARISELEKQSDELNKKKQELANRIEKLTNDKSRLTLELQEEKRRVDALASDKSIQQARLDEAMKNIRSLGTIGADISKYHDMDSKKLLSSLHKTRDELSKMGHVNKKALDQFTSMVESRESLVKKREEIEKERKSIADLLLHLDARKDDSIARTFKQVKHEFEAIFRQLVQHREGASAELVMLRRTDASQMTQESPPRRRTAGAATQQDSVENFIGVRIEVNFGDGGTTHLVERLSGGQKSLVALALIFAIQRCDPAPFYLFDEIDAALDPAYRSSVAAMVTEQSEHAQFITSTFKPELVDAADRHYAIVFKNKVSKIRRVDVRGAHLILKAAAEDAAAQAAAAGAGAPVLSGEEGVRTERAL